MGFIRGFQDGKPHKPEHQLKWSPAGSKDGELVFVSGHPGRTNRQNTLAELQYLRDVQYPTQLALLNRREVLLGSWSERSEENRRRAKEDFFRVQNSRKARVGGLGGLPDPKLVGRKAAEEKRLREFVDKQGYKEAAQAFETIEKAERLRAEIARDVNLFEGGQAFNSHLYGIGQTLLRVSEELPKPS